MIFWLCQVLAATLGIFSLGMKTLSCGMWDLVPWAGMELGSLALNVQSLSHWTTRQVSLSLFFKEKIFYFHQNRYSEM